MEWTNGTTQRLYVPSGVGGAPVVWYEGADFDTPRWMHADGQDSILAYSDANGIASAPIGYDAYGLQPSWTAAGHYTYTGHFTAFTNQLIDYTARMYDPVLGRFTSPDPIGQAGGVNIYAYVEGDPVNLIDPSGLADCDPDCGPWGVGGVTVVASGGSGGGGSAGGAGPRTPFGQRYKSIGDAGSAIGFADLFGKVPQNKACNATAAVAFVQAHQADAARLAAMNGNTTAEILGLSMAEVGPGGNTLSRVGNNYFSMEGSNLPYATGTARTSGGATFATYSSYYYSGLSFLSVYGSSLRGITNPTAFAQALVPGYNSGNSANGGTSGFVQNTASVINSTAARMGCP